MRGKILSKKRGNSKIDLCLYIVQTEELKSFQADFTCYKGTDFYFCSQWFCFSINWYVCILRTNFVKTWIVFFGMFPTKTRPHDLPHTTTHFMFLTFYQLLSIILQRNQENIVKSTVSTASNGVHDIYTPWHSKTFIGSRVTIFRRCDFSSKYSFNLYYFYYFEMFYE